MKIFIVYDCIYPYVRGGVEKRNWEIARRLALKNEVHLIGLKWWKGPATINREEVFLHGVAPPIELYNKKGKRRIFEAVYFSFHLFFFLMKERFDLIECSEFPFLPIFVCKFYSLLKRKTFTATWYEVWGDYWYGYVGRIKGIAGKAIEWLASRMPEKIIANSENTKIKLIAGGIKKEKIIVIANGIDLKEIYSIPFSEKKFDVLFVGRLIKEKNIDVLIESISIARKSFPLISCGIIGEGPEKKKLIALRNKFDLEKNIGFFGEVKEDREIISLMKSAKLFVLPSTREGFSIAVLEAGACGLPVITVRHENNAAMELIEEGKNGFIVELNAKRIAEKIILLLKNPSLQKKMSAETKKNLEPYDWKKITAETEKIYLKN